MLEDLPLNFGSLTSNDLMSFVGCSPARYCWHGFCFHKLHKGRNTAVMESKDAHNLVSSRKRADTSFQESEGPKTRQWFFLMVCFGGLLALGNWAVSRHDGLWTSARIWVQKGYLGGRRTNDLFELKKSPLGQPWSQVSTLFDSEKCEIVS